MNIFQLEERIRENPDSPLCTRLASQYLIRGKILEAVDLLLKSIKLYPDYSTSYVILARCYASKKRFSEALLCSKKTFSLQPDSFILKNLIPNWEKQSNENIEVKYEDSINLPDLNTLENILFPRFESAKLQPDKETIEYQEIIKQKENLPEVTNQIETIEQEILQEVQDNVLDDDKEKDHTVVEFVTEKTNDLTEVLDVVVKSIELEDLEPPNEQGPHIIEELNKVQELEATSSSDYVIEQVQNLESVNQEVLVNDLTGVQESIKQNKDDEAIQIPENLSQSISENIIDEKKEIEGLISIEPTQTTETQKDLTNVDYASKGIDEDENIKKSDEHITKIFESAQETLKKEAETLQEGFNNEQVPELPQIVSATLAEIYTRQGEFEEAIKTYKALIKLRPKQKELFERKIEELEKKLKSIN